MTFEDTRILGFVTISPATLLVDDLPEGRRMPPYPVPVLQLARPAPALKLEASVSAGSFSVSRL